MKSRLIINIVAAIAIIGILAAWPVLAAQKEKPCQASTTQADKACQSPPLEYQLLFFRNDGRIWVVLPPKTTLLEIYPSIGRIQGWVKAYNRRGEVLAVDKEFNGDVQITVASNRPSLKKGKLVVTRHDETSVAIYTPENASFIEIINSRNGFDGVVNVRDRKKRLLNSESGLDLKIINMK